MTTTDTDALTERLWNALSGHRPRLTDTELYPGGAVDRIVLGRIDDVADALTSIVAVEVRKAKAEAWDEGQHDLYLYYQSEGLAGSEGRNPYRETGDSDEHR